MRPRPMGTYAIEPTPSDDGPRWIVTVGPRWESLPLSLAHLRIYVKNLRKIAHARRV